MLNSAFESHFIYTMSIKKCTITTSDVEPSYFLRNTKDYIAVTVH